MRSQCLSLILVWGLAALLPGCQEAPIERYTAPREERPPLFPENPTVRLLGALIVHGEDTWFFKLVGPVDAVAAQKAAFDTFLRSVRFTGKDDPPLTWTVPEGWQKETPPPSRYAVFHLGPKDNPLELSVSRLGRGGEASSVLANVNRWRGNDLGLPRPLHEADLAHVVRNEEVAGVTVTFVDMGGPGSFRAPRPGGGAVARASLHYTAPEGWQSVPANREFGQEAAFRISDGDRTANMSVSTAGGNLLQNINRWREQVGLPEVGPNELPKLIQKVRVGGASADYVDLVGPEAAGGKRTLGAILSRDGRTWFFKLHGPAGLVEKEKSRFEQFLASVRFNSGGGDNDG